MMQSLPDPSSVDEAPAQYTLVRAGSPSGPQRRGYWSPYAASAYDTAAPADHDGSSDGEYAERQLVGTREQTKLNSWQFSILLRP